MPIEQVSAHDLSRQALRHFSREELQRMPYQQRVLLMDLIREQLETGQEPTDAQLEGFRELVAMNWPEGLEAASEPSPASATPASPTSASQPQTATPLEPLSATAATPDAATRH